MAVDPFGLEQVPLRILDREEAAALLEVLQALRTHPAVAFDCSDVLREHLSIGR